MIIRRFSIAEKNLKNGTLLILPIMNSNRSGSWNSLWKFVYPLENDTLTIGYRTGSSNHVTADGMVVIEHDQGDLLIMECSDW
jgi:thiamine pyrophosphokinase